MPSLTFDTAHRFIGQPIFTGHMSHNARALLELIVGALNKYGAEPGGTNKLVVEFAQNYHPTTYEDAVLGWDWRGLEKILKNRIKRWTHAKSDEVLALAYLSPLFGGELDVMQSPKSQFRFTHSNSRMDIYWFVTNEFLLEDFSESALIQLSEIAKTHALEDVKAACARVTSPDKKFIPYLYRVLSNAERVEAAVAAETKRQTADSMARIQQVLAPTQQTGIKVPYNPNWKDDVEMTRRMYEEIEDETAGE